MYYCDKHYNDDAPQEYKDNMPSPETKRMQREAEAEEEKRRGDAQQFDDSRSSAGSTANSSINGIQAIDQYSQIEDDIIRLCRETGQTQFIYNQLMEFSNDSGRQSQSPYIFGYLTGAMQSSCSISHPMEYPDEYSDD